MKLRLLVSFAITLTITSCSKSLEKQATPPPPPFDTTRNPVDTPRLPTQMPSDTADDNNMLMGNLSNATRDTSNANNYLMVKPYYTVSYNRDRGIPNWVCWHVKPSDLGTVTRQDDFRIDVSLPSTWFRPDENSYVSSGFDRGHNCPSADRTSTVAANSSTFLMTNMIPQAPNNNQQTWAVLEDSTRRLVQAGNEVYVIMGNYGVGGTGSKGSANTIANGNVSVPANVWKVIIVLPAGINDLSRITPDTRVIAINTPNVQTVSRNWKLYRTSIQDIEALTGYDLLSNVAVATQQALETKVDNL